MNIGSQLAKIAAKRKVSMIQVVRESVIRVGNEIVQRSPVDTGRFRNNWLGAVGSPDQNANVPPDPSGARALGSLRTAAASTSTGDVMYYTNSVPYAFRLEYMGWSNQAPQGMVRVSVQSFRSIVNQEVAKIK